LVNVGNCFTAGTLGESLAKYILKYRHNKYISVEY
jgi:hypothetical protein